MSSSENMATYQTLKQLYTEGCFPIKTKFRKRDNSIETAISLYQSQGSIYPIRYAIKCHKNKIHVVEALEKAQIPVLPTFPNLTGPYLQYKGELTYENAIKHGSYAIYHLLKETHREHGNDAVDKLREKLLGDGIPDNEILYYNLPDEIKKVLFSGTPGEALEAVIEFYKENHPKINFIVYDFVRNSPNAIDVTKKLLAGGIPKTLIGSTALVSVAAGKMSVQELQVLYDFDSPHFVEIMEYMLNNPSLFGHKSASSLAEKMVYHGIDKITILSGKR